MRRITHIAIIFILVGLFSYPGCGYAQREGDIDYQHHSYQEAIRKYKALAKKDPNNAVVLFNLANSYRLNGQLPEAEHWFAKAVELNSDIRAKLYYAQTLLSNRKYSLAKEWFQHFAAQSTNPSDVANARKLAEQCDRLSQNGIVQQQYEVRKSDFNSQKLDFSPMFWKDGQIVFASNRQAPRGHNNEVDPWTGDPFVDLWVVGFDLDGKPGNPSPFTKNLNSRYHEGPVSFSGDGETMYFTRSDYVNRRRGFDEQRNTALKILEATRQGDKWSAPQELPFNESRFSSCHPALSSGGDTLVFASDRAGGFGGMDLWMVLRDGKSWSSPRNLGPEINTAGNEVFPFLDTRGELYFSSDFHPGIGGLDVFSARVGKDRWISPENIGSPINSPLDDFGFIVDLESNSGYFSSSRSGRSDDIYAFTKIGGLKLWAQVVDCKTGSPLSGMTVMHKGEACFSDEAGWIEVTVRAGEFVELQVNGEGYYAQENCDGKATYCVPAIAGGKLPVLTLPVTTESNCCFGFSDNDPWVRDSELRYQWSFGDGNVAQGSKVGHCFRQDGSFNAKLEVFDPKTNQKYVKAYKQVDVQNCNPLPVSALIIAGTSRHKQLYMPVPEASLTFINRCTGEQTTVKTDSKGNYAFKIKDEGGCNYLIIGQKSGFVGEQTEVSLKGKKYGLIRKDVFFEDQETARPAAAGAQAQWHSAQAVDTQWRPDLQRQPVNWSADPRRGNVMSEDNFSRPLERGAVIELYNIYFDLDKADIRPDAVTDLQFLLVLLRKYPNMQGEIAAHTDSRASDIYNLRLSDRRAQAAKEWLVMRGIDPLRLATRGFGEYQLRNGCADAVPCTEKEHQRNRRVEFHVTDFDGIINSKEYEYFQEKPVTAQR